MERTELITAKEISKIIPLSVRHIAEAVTKRKDFPRAYRIGSIRFWKKTEVNEWFEKRKEI